MNEPKRDESSGKTPAEPQVPSGQPTSHPSKTVPVSDADPSKPVEELTPEEQMALFEEQLKEDDWGHQPC